MDRLQLSPYLCRMAEQTFDIAIVGAGPTGASLALGLAQSGLEVALIDARDLSQPARRDGRNFAIVTGSWRLLNGIGVAESLRETSQPLNGLEAVDGGTHWFGQPSVLFTKNDIESIDPDEPLGQMVMAEPLQARLDQALEEEARITHLTNARFVTSRLDGGSIVAELESGNSVKAWLLVGADGMNSPVRQAAGIPTEGRDYQKSVFTANVHLAQPHDGIARQLFTPEGPFATLPLKGDRANLAWYMKRGAAETLVKQPVEAIEAELNARFADFSGEMKLDGAPGSYPLILQLATALTAPRTVIIGDAARRVNPLAGQGLNQGFRDVGALIEIAQETLRLGGEIGSPQMLEAFSQARRLDGAGTALALDAIDRLFSNDHTLTKPVRTLGLLAASKISPLRRMLARKASATEDGVAGPLADW
ncbi:MAG: FAD-dependent oxidoreductase [Pseudomonadota bacterium]